MQEGGGVRWGDNASSPQLKKKGKKIIFVSSPLGSLWIGPMNLFDNSKCTTQYRHKFSPLYLVSGFAKFSFPTSWL